MFSIFPADWDPPRQKRLFGSKKPIPNLPAPVIPSKPATLPAPVPRPVNIQIPVCEMCVGEQLDENEMAKIDKMLDEIFNPTPESQARQIQQMINVVNKSLQKNISGLENSPVTEGDTVSREDLLKLLQVFLNYSRQLENYFKSINQVPKI
jgi:hypothetical protein